MKGPPRYAIELKRLAIARVNAGERVSAVARDLQIQSHRLYYWRARYRAGGEAALHGTGRPRQAVATAAARAWSDGADELSAAKRQIAELQRKVGEQQVDLDFFRRALRHVKARQPASAAPGGGLSTRSSKR